MVRTKYLISTDTTEAFLQAGGAFCDWLETLDPETCSLMQVADAQLIHLLFSA